MNVLISIIHFKILLYFIFMESIKEKASIVF